MSRIRLAALVGVMVTGSGALPVPDARVGRLINAPPMSVARAAHSATALPNGDVLIVGGFSRDEGVIGGAELFDARSGRFRAAGTGVTLRQSHSATLLPSGQVLIVGGYDARGGVLASAELYDPATGRFVATGALQGARAGHEAVLLRDGRVLIVGGVGPGWSFLNSAELFDPRTGRFAPTGAMRVPRESHVAMRLTDGRVLVAGGHHGRSASIVIESSSELYDPATGRFSAAAAMQVKRHKHDAIALADGSLLIVGGADERDDRGVYVSTERYDPVAARFTSQPALSVGRYKLRGTTIVLLGGRLLVAGGAGQAEERDLVTGMGALVPGESPLAGQFSAATPLPDGRVLITGGYGHGRGPVASAWIYAPSVTSTGTSPERADTPAQVAQSLLDADRAFAAAGARTDLLSALSAMFAAGVIMPTPQGGFATGKSAVMAAIRATPDATTARATWTPIRVGISADGEHGFTFGYMTLYKPDSTQVPLKYMAYWVREAGGWHVLAYKRGRSAGPVSDAVPMAPSLPTAIIAVRRDPTLIATLRHALMRHESSFSDEAQRIGLGNAFAAFGTADAVNMGGAASATYVVGAPAIAAMVARGDMKASAVTWSADTALVASSGDLGITFGVIRETHPAQGSDPKAGSPFFTIWRKADSRSPWRYVAE